MREPIWLSREQIDAIHEDQLRQHGGLEGVRDVNGLEAALVRPRNLFLHERCDLPDMAAAYAHGIVKNHPFNDGNKRAAFAAAVVFLDINGLDFIASEEEATIMVIGLADSSLSQKQFAALLRQNCRHIKNG